MITSHNAHDPDVLWSRWQKVAAVAGLELKPFHGKMRDAEVWYLETPALQNSGGIYLSAGIHGDEAGATEGLIHWAEKNIRKLRDLPLLIFPCLNPWGLRSNRRNTAEDIDLNRMFHRVHPVIDGIKRVVGERQFSAALTLHEDYDGQGLYLYEVYSSGDSHGQTLLAAAQKHVPLDSRTDIDGSRANNGLIRRRYSKRRFDAMGYPEAIWLHLKHSRHAFTIEAPSEFALNIRVRAIAAVVSCAIQVFVGR